MNTTDYDNATDEGGEDIVAVPKSAGMKRAVIHLSMDMLRTLLLLPDDVTVLHIAPGHHGLSLALVITADDMAEIDPGMLPPPADVEVRLVDGRPVVDKVHYDRAGEATA